jgi:hypothetical protein
MDGTSSLLTLISWNRQARKKELKRLRKNAGLEKRAALSG